MDNADTQMTQHTGMIDCAALLTTEPGLPCGDHEAHHILSATVSAVQACAESLAPAIDTFEHTTPGCQVAMYFKDRSFTGIRTMLG
eukprot:363074-Chlamydomonas_euryale.AAC.14